jgi:hypothetical protein
MGRLWLLLALIKFPTFVVLAMFLSLLLSLLAAVAVKVPWKAFLIRPFLVALVLDGFRL